VTHPGARALDDRTAIGLLSGMAAFGHGRYGASIEHFPNLWSEATARRRAEPLSGRSARPGLEDA
jgi:hypothetical protein